MQQIAQRRKRASKKKKKKNKRTAAAKADRHALYQRAVQDPDTDAESMVKLYRRYRSGNPRVLREDFCGTAALSIAWAKSGPKRKAIGVDLDRETLDWGQENNLDVHKAGSRVELHCANVVDGVGSKSDIVCALNFSYNALQTRDLLLQYFKATRGCLKKDGVFILDVFGGTEAMMDAETSHDLGDFTYRWEQETFDPLSHHMVCHIHFEFPDGSELSPAFSYDWRIWTVPELREVLEEAGFRNIHILWEETDDNDDGTGKFYEPEAVENQLSWWTYIVAER